MAKKYWLMKTEPSVFSFEDLLKAPGKTTAWEGVRNYQARNLMRDDFQLGDLAFIYHSGIAEPEIAGIAEIAKTGYPDPFAMDPKSKYFDPDAKKKGVNPWILVDVKAKKRFKKSVTRSQLKDCKALADMMVLKKGARLSVQPVTEAEFKTICDLSDLENI
jgi:predicted RNA-binding protein with PUA-like domain